MSSYGAQLRNPYLISGSHDTPGSLSYSATTMSESSVISLSVSNFSDVLNAPSLDECYRKCFIINLTAAHPSISY